MIAGKSTDEWLQHRAGLNRLTRHPRAYSTRALELTDNGAAFTNAFGQREIKGFVGFVDLIGFSTRVAGSSPSEISEYLKPFLVGITDKAVDAGALVDKTIGDEVMFVVPDMEADGGVPGIFDMSFLLGSLHDLQRSLGPNYPFRIGLSYGLQFVDRIEGKGYSEWTLLGESVNLAKRLHTLPGAEPKDGLGGAFGVLAREVTEQEFRSILNFIAGFASRMTHEITNDAFELKGISAARYAILLPKMSSEAWSAQRRQDIVSGEE